MASCQVYRGTLPGKVYIGCTRLTLQERLRSLKGDRPVHWLKNEDLSNLRLTPLHLRRVAEDRALALEAAYTAVDR